MARPRKAESDKMSDMLRIPLTPDQKQTIDEAARVANPSGTAAWARIVLLEAARSTVRRKNPSG
jgi:hypothetical protein